MRITREWGLNIKLPSQPGPDELEFEKDEIIAVTQATGEVWRGEFINPGAGKVKVEGLFARDAVECVY